MYNLLKTRKYVTIAQQFTTFVPLFRIFKAIYETFLLLSTHLIDF